MPRGIVAAKQVEEDEVFNVKKEKKSKKINIKNATRSERRETPREREYGGGGGGGPTR